MAIQFNCRQVNDLLNAIFQQQQQQQQQTGLKNPDATSITSYKPCRQGEIGSDTGKRWRSREVKISREQQDATREQPEEKAESPSARTNAEKLEIAKPDLFLEKCDHLTHRDDFSTSSKASQHQKYDMDTDERRAPFRGEKVASLE
jgi:hypothetical protein